MISIDHILLDHISVIYDIFLSIKCLSFTKNLANAKHLIVGIFLADDKLLVDDKHLASIKMLTDLTYLPDLTTDDKLEGKYFCIM